MSFSFFRAAYGLLLLGSLLLYLPQTRRFFLSERWKGYGESSPFVDLIQNPLILPWVGLIWFASALGIFAGYFPVLSSLANLILCWYFFVGMRWKGILRGAGAPGFITYWLAAAVFLIEYTSRYASHLRSLALLTLQWDLALILFSSGFYKFRSGYPQNEGMEYGLVNPEWGYWCQFYRRLSPQHWIFKLYNQLAWTSQILLAVLMLFPTTRFWGGVLLIASFVMIMANIRLGFLCPMMMLTAVLFFEPGIGGDSPGSVSTFFSVFNFLLGYGLVAYLALLPFAYGGIYYNFYGRKTLPQALQRALEGYTQFFGISIWRVFTIDLVNFFIQIYRAPQKNPARRILISEWEKIGNGRYRHVAESIAVTSIFTTLKYHPHDPALFRERLLRYSRTIPCSPEEVLIFEYVRIVKGRDGFDFHPATEFSVDAGESFMEEKILDSQFSPRRIPEVSPVREGLSPGSYQFRDSGSRDPS